MSIDSSSQHISEFASKLIHEKGLDDLDPEIKEQAKNDLSSRIEDHINAAILSKLHKQQLMEFESILNASNQTQIQEFLKKSIPDMDNLIAQTLIDFRITYLG